MIEAEIDPGDLHEFYVDMKGLRPKELLKGNLGPFVREVGKQTSKYPPPVESPYVRTEHLLGSWYYRVIDSLSAEVGNLAIYAGYVHGPEQVKMHDETGWRRLFEIGEASIKAFIRVLEEKADRIWRS